MCRAGSCDCDSSKMLARVLKPCQVTFSTTFAPVQDIEGYVRSLRHDGWTEDRLEEIRQKYTPPPKDPPKEPKWVCPIKFLDQVLVKMTVTDRVRIKLSVPFEEMIPYVYGPEPIPLGVRVRCYMRAGAPDELVERMIKRDTNWFTPENQKKQQEILERIFGKDPVKKVLVSVKKKPAKIVNAGPVPE